MKRLSAIIFFSFIAALCLAQDFTIKAGQHIKICVPQNVRPVVTSAVGMFANDALSVLGSKTNIVMRKKKAVDIILNTNTSLPREGFRITVTNGKLLIEGADDHGLAYGILEISRMMGVSPWEYWADCTPRRRDVFTIAENYKNEQHPAVAYRGIFINDEDWGLNPWATRCEPEAWTLKAGRIKGAIGPKTNEKIFQLLLRLRANYYWPAMHECSQPFFTITGNREMAKKYGIYIGGSHCEPMATSPAVEWGVRGHGEYNYVTNRDSVKQFWRERLNEVKDQEVVFTLGMRGVHDGAMQGVKTKEEKLTYLQQVIDDQRAMLKECLGVNDDELKNIPQVFVPYKEVLEIYHDGLRVPDDVTLMWTDDNYGYIRHFPDSVERLRNGGNGLYYHISYWGRPHDYLWLNSMTPQVMVPQLTEAYQRGIQNMWIVNVGDLKPSEYQTELFMDLAWKGSFNNDWYKNFFAREFGDSLSAPISDIMTEHFRLMNDCKPEFLGGTRTEEKDKAYWNTIHRANDDWTKADVEKRVKDYRAISDKVEHINNLIPNDRRDAFYEMVKYPVQAAAQMNFKFLCPDICNLAYDSIQSLTHYYNKVCANGKWDGILSCSPRNLAVYKKVSADELPTYPTSNGKTKLKCISHSTDTLNNTIDTFTLETNQGNDSITLEIHVFPHHPINGERITLQISADGQNPTSIDYQTYDRNEEWKQNVLRGYAKRIITIPVDANKERHTITLCLPSSEAPALFHTFSPPNQN